MMYQICQHAVGERSHRLVHCETIADQRPFVQELVNLLQKDLAEVEVDDMSDSNQELFPCTRFLPWTVLEQSNHNIREGRKEVV